MKRLNCGVVVWGAAYIDTMVSLALPSFLAPGNLPACRQVCPVRFTIVTRPEDESAVRSNAIVQELGKHAELRVVPLLGPGAFGENRYHAMMLGHQLLISESLRDGSVLSLLSPDCILSDGTLRKGLARLWQGKSAILVAGLRAELESMSAPLLRFRGPSPSAPLVIPPRDLVSLALKNLHAISKILFWTDQPFSAFPSAIYWRVGTDSMLAKYFHLHPILVDLSVANREAARSAAIDGSLLELARIGPSDSYIVVDSDEMCVIELSSRDHDVMGSLPIEVADKTRYVAGWARSHAMPAHRRQFFAHMLRFRGLAPVDWAPAEQQVSRDLRSLSLRLRMMNMLGSPARASLRFQKFMRQGIRDMRTAWLRQMFDRSDPQ